MTGTVAVRMYDVGFGDAFVVTVDRAGHVWRMLVDCGVHSQGAARPIEQSVAAIIADLTAACGVGGPHLDVVVATHHHADHISGFAKDAWDQVTVDEVWVPFVEDANDPDARRLRRAQDAAAQRIAALADARLAVSGADEDARTARMLAANSRGNAAATDRLLGRNGRSFRNVHRVRFLPDLAPAANVLQTTHPDVVAHVLGPSRDEKQLRRMDPPASARWLRLDDAALDGIATDRPLFAPIFVGPGPEPQVAAALRKQLRLDQLGDDALLGAAAVLENAVNNTSILFVLDVAGIRLLFPGDSQEGAWDHVLDNPAAAELLRGVDFFKIAHHGSGNATPKRFVDSVLGDGSVGMLPWGLVERWATTIPQQNLMAGLTAHHHRVIRADDPQPGDGVTVAADGLWSELSLDLP